LIAEMYKRREKAGYVFLGIVVFFLLGWIVFQTPETVGGWFEMLVFLIPLGLVLSIIGISRSQYNKVKNFNIPDSLQQLTDLDHLVIKKDVAFIPRLLLFEKEGNFVGVIKPIHISWWKYPFFIFHELAALLPLTYAFISSDRNVQFTFRKKGWLKQIKLSIFSQENKQIGTYLQEELKALFHIKGQLLNEKDEPVLTIQASGFSGDFQWKDEMGKTWAYFYNDRFPFEYTKIFRDTYNDLVKLSDSIPKQEKTLLLAVIGYLFVARIKQ